MDNIKKQKLFFVLPTGLMFLFIFIVFLIFNSGFSTHMNSDVEGRLQENLDPNIVSFNLQMNEQIKKVNTSAEFLSENWDLGRDVHTSLLQSAVTNNDLLRCAIGYPDGSFITHDSKNDGDISKDAFFIANMNGNFFITDPRAAVVDKSKMVILFSAPIIDKSGNILGCITYSYLCDNLNKIFNLKSMGGKMKMVVANEHGDVLIGSSEFASSQENLIDSLKSHCLHKDHTPDKCLNFANDSGISLISFDNADEKIYVRYNKLDFNDWRMVAMISESDAAANISSVAQNQRDFIGIIAFVILAYLSSLVAIWLLQRKMVDPFTGAMTIYAFKRKSKEIFKNRTHDSFVVVKLDVKDFKLINRIHSFATGDRLIKNVAKALKMVLKDDDTIFARVGVDIFVLLLPYDTLESLETQRNTFLHNFHNLMDENFSTRIVFPTGQYVLQPSDYPKPDMDELLEKVNFAHRAAKVNGSIIIDYTSDIESAALFEKNIEDRMGTAIRDKEFLLYLQPKIHVATEKICSAEALVRWKLSDDHFIYPSDFIPVLEKNGFIVQVDKYMFKCAAMYIRDLIDRGIEPISISVNFSRLHLNNVNFVNELCKIADDCNVPHKYLEVELTESAFLGNVETIVKFISELHKEGFTISMDDFGSGYSCFAQLKDLKIDVLKIDRDFFSENEDEKRAEIVIAGILKIAQDLNIVTVAEGVEQKSQVDTLRNLGCDIIQGYYYAKPIPSTQLDISTFTVNK